METGMRPHTHVHLRFVGDKTCALYIYTPHVLLRFVHLRTRMSEAASTIICGYRLYWLIGGL